MNLTRTVPRRPLAVAVIALGLLGAAACSSSDKTGTAPSSDQLATDINGPTDTGASIPPGSVEVRFVPAEAADAATLDRAAAALRDRVRVLALKGVVVEVRDGSVVANVPKGVDRARVEALADPHDLAFRPVQQAFPGAANDNTTDPRCSDPAAQPSMPCLAADERDPGTTLLLGPSAVDGAVVGQVTTSQGQADTWIVTLTPAGDRKASLAGSVNDCFTADAACPATTSAGDVTHGRLAIVLDGVVLTSATVTQANAADSGLQISGDYTKEQAEKLADELRLASKPVPVALRPA